MNLKSLAAVTLVAVLSLPAFSVPSQAQASEGQASSAPKHKHKKTAKKSKAPKAVYKCPMDGYTSDKPGKCPNCGMDLEKQEPSKPSANK